MESIWTTPCGFHDHSIPFHIYFIVKVHSLYTILYGFHMEHGGECKVHLTSKKKSYGIHGMGGWNPPIPYGT